MILVNDYAISTAIIGFIFLVSLKFPVTAQLFMVLLLIVGIVNMRSQDRYVKGPCETCRLYDNERDLCMYTSNGVCNKDCKAYKEDRAYTQHNGGE
jgi:hypothetical protein